jgi:hypothetical protein
MYNHAWLIRFNIEKVHTKEEETDPRTKLDRKNKI